MHTDGTRGVMELLDASFTSAAVGAALELRLFWLIDERPMPAEAIARRLGIRPEPCAHWLELLRRAGFAEEGPDGYRTSARARLDIVRAHEADTWALLAQEARERLPVLLDLPAAMRSAEGVRARPDYVSVMAASPERARRFTRMLYDLHRRSAEKFAAWLDVSGVRRLLDIGGGSGVVSLALATRHAHLRAVVVDVAYVCEAGRELAAERGLDDRVTYHAADFTADALPAGFDLALMCDVGVYSPALFARIRDALVPGGRLVIADAFWPEPGVAPRSRVHWALEGALVGGAHGFTSADVERLLAGAGFEVGPTASVEAVDADMASVVTATARSRSGSGL